MMVNLLGLYLLTTVLSDVPRNRMYDSRTSRLSAPAKQGTRSEGTREDSCSPSSQFRNSMGRYLLNESTKWITVDGQRCVGG